LRVADHLTRKPGVRPNWFTPCGPL
jgi:hypothetical protein